MINFTSTASIAYRSLITNKVRSFLTMLGVIIGVSAVILLVGIGSGLQIYITQQFESLGSNNIIIMPGDIFGEGGGFAIQQSVSSLTLNKLRLSHVEDIKKLRQYVTAVTAAGFGSAKISWKNKSKTTSVVSVNAEYGLITNTLTTSGRFFNKNEDRTAEKVAVLGSEISQELFGTTDPVGKTIKINNQSYEVVGLAKAFGGGFAGHSHDTYVYIPLKTGFRLFDNKQIYEILVKVKSAEVMTEANQAIKDLLLKDLEKDEFSVLDQKEILDAINKILAVLTLGLGGIAAISLLVGGIGIMNIMLVSVTERTKEIGLRKALGATPNQILIQFLIEAVILSITGGMIGVSISYGISLLIQRVFPLTITLAAVTLAFGVSAAVGIIFGVYPANKAARLSPVDALRYE